MKNNLQQLRNEHIETLSHVLAIRHLADSVGHAHIAEILLGIDETCDFFVHRYLPYAKAVEQVLYPEIARLRNAPCDTGTLTRDHAEIRHLVGDLSGLREHLSARGATVDTEHSLRRVLYGLDVLIRLHVSKAEDIYLPLISDHLDASAQADLVQRMQRAAAMARHPSAQPSTVDHAIA